MGNSSTKTLTVGQIPRDNAHTETKEFQNTGKEPKLLVSLPGGANIISNIRVTDNKYDMVNLQVGAQILRMVMVNSVWVYTGDVPVFALTEPCTIQIINPPHTESTVTVTWTRHLVSQLEVTKSKSQLLTDGLMTYQNNMVC